MAVKIGEVPIKEVLPARIDRFRFYLIGARAVWNAGGPGAEPSNYRQQDYDRGAQFVLERADPVSTTAFELVQELQYKKDEYDRRINGKDF